MNVGTTGTGDAATLGLRARRISDAVLNKVSKFRTQPPTIDEWLLGAKAARLADIPFSDFDETRAELTKFIKRSGCCEVLVLGDRVSLSELAQQMESAAELLQPYRTLLGGVR